MAVNKVQLANGTVLLDTSSVTVSAPQMVEGITALDKTGTQITGTLIIQRYYTGSSAPSSSLGNNGDLYLEVGS